MEMQKLALLAIFFAVITVSLTAPAGKKDEQLEELLASNIEANRQTKASMQQGRIPNWRRIFLNLPQDERDAILQQFSRSWPWGVDFQNPFNIELPVSADTQDDHKMQDALQQQQTLQDLFGEVLPSVFNFLTNRLTQPAGPSDAILQRNRGNWQDFLNSFEFPLKNQDVTSQRLRNFRRGLDIIRNILNSLPASDKQRAMQQQGASFWDRYQDILNSFPRQDADARKLAEQVRAASLSSVFPFSDSRFRG